MRQRKSFLFIIFIPLLNTLCAQPVTYKNVAPIFLTKCASCHRNGDAGPFPLTTYEDIAKRASFIQEVITENFMPPWRADIHYRDFANNRMLTDKEKKTILQWIKNGSPKGSNVSNENRSLLDQTTYGRKPDLVLTIDSPFTVKGDNNERFVMFKVPFDFANAQNVEAVEFFSNNKKIMHHINYGFYEVADSAVDITKAPNFINSVDDTDKTKDPFAQVNKKMVYYTGWIPGTAVENYPANFGWVLPKRGVVLFTAHYSATAAEEKSIVGINLFFRKEPVTRQIQIISLGSGGIGENQITPPLFLPANQESTFHLKVTNREDRSFMYVWPHMHLTGKEFTAFAVTPALDTIPLIHIPRWDFRWQEQYKFKQLVKIPARSVIHIDCVYDNTADNPFNPNNPPKPIYSYGNMSSKAEMMTLLLIFSPYKEGDENIHLQ